MSPRTVLYVSHNHPVIRPGGAEAYAFELHEAIRDETDWESMFLARTGPPFSTSSRYHEGTLLTGVDDRDPGQYFFYTELNDFDWLLNSTREKSTITTHFREFLLAQRPDVVHFQHTLFIGLEAIREARNTLPDAAIVYTLHEFLPICHRHGQMLRATDEEPCLEESPRRCHECFPEVPPQEFFMRKRLIQSHMEHVDLFIAPSRQLRDRYVDWGLPAEKIKVEEYGRLPLGYEPGNPRRKKRNRFGFFGQFSHYKGVNVVLQAAKRLVEDEVDVKIYLHGANLEIQPEEFQKEFAELLEASGDGVILIGRYDHDQLGSLMEHVDWVLVPSRWWENSPLVIQEAFMHGRPVICSDIGGMAEKVADGVDGLHFRVGDPEDLARVIAQAAASPQLWRTLTGGIRPVYPMPTHVEEMLRVYEGLLAGDSDLAPPPADDDGAAIGATS
jgi:glycosyltransferase involved in cell wall biosynthesis